MPLTLYLFPTAVTLASYGDCKKVFVILIVCPTRYQCMEAVTVCRILILYEDMSFPFPTGCQWTPTRCQSRCG
jgi:hypothetical protein